MNLNPLDALRDKARQWAQDVKTLMDTPVPPELVGEKASLINNAKTIKETLESVLGTVDELAPMNFGFLPIIGVGAIGVALAAVTAWYASHDSLNEKLKAYNDLIKSGIPHNQAMSITTGLANTQSGNKTSIFSTPLIIVALAGGYFLLNKGR